MKNYKKLLFAGLAIVPLALSSWTSEDQSLNYGSGNASTISTIEVIGEAAVSSSVVVKEKKKVFSKETVETVDVVSEKGISTSIETTLSFNEIINEYK